MRWHRNTQTGVWSAADTFGGHYLVEPVYGGWWLDYLPYTTAAVTGSFAKCHGPDGAKAAAESNHDRRKAERVLAR